MMFNDYKSVLLRDNIIDMMISLKLRGTLELYEVLDRMSRTIENSMFASSTVLIDPQTYSGFLDQLKK